ncbi:unnamed protein product [Mytilus coruscus]|uniref:Integrase p58-like C-terminal domain-containing protein n=1 Tax=Mytilus coruscus TaxID=42192 RepID=A0A6J8E955_MYTCO|nr:unnamed protein product [Mytilus coruscus]
MMLGRETMQPVDLLLGTAESNIETNQPCQYIKDLRNALEKAHKTTRDNLKATQFRQKRDYDVKLYHRIYNKGDKIDSTTEIGESKKLRASWQGPYLIAEVLSSVLYKMRTRKRELTIHHDQLKPCSDRSIPQWLKYMRHRLLQVYKIRVIMYSRTAKSWKDETEMEAVYRQHYEDLDNEEDRDETREEEEDLRMVVDQKIKEKERRKQEKKMKDISK